MDGINRSKYSYGKRQKKAIIFILSLVIILSSISVLVFNYSFINVNKGMNMDPNMINNVSAVNNNSRSSSIVIEGSTGTVIDGVNIDTRLPMASTTKIMTAYLAVTSGRLEEYVTTPEYATRVEGSSIYLKAGEELKLIDLVYGLMLRSGNDSAVTIAHFLAGSVENFAGKMNDKVKELGLENTNFVNPHGLHDDNHYTSASDLAIITKNALDNDVFRTVSVTKSHRCANSDGDVKVFVNKNKLLTAYPDCIGVKTGYTKAAGRCLVSASERNGVRAICVVLNCPDMWQESRCYLEQAQNSCSNINIASKGQVIETVKTHNDQLLNAVLHEDINLIIFRNKSYNINYSIKYDDDLEKSVVNDEKIGIILIFDGKHLLFERNIYNMII